MQNRLSCFLSFACLIPIAFIGCSASTNGKNLKRKDGKYVWKKSGTLFSGIATWYYDNGWKKRQGVITKGVKNGPYQEWHRNGRLKTQGTYNNGEEDGLWNHWYENGNKRFEVNFQWGTKDGAFKYWYENGQLKQSGNVQQRKYHGKQEWWDENGKKTKEEIYEKGRRVSRNDYE